MIELASLQDKNEIMDLIKAAIQDMRYKGLDQWDDIYPDEGTIADDICSKTLFKYIDNSIIAAIVTINDQDIPEYDQISWSDSSKNYYVVHRLTVHPEYQGSGLATKMMTFCEEFAAQKNKTSIRLDAFTKNQAACNLYQKLGFFNKGIVEFRKGSFFCFEKQIKKVDKIIMKEISNKWDNLANDWEIQVGLDGDKNRMYNSDPVLWAFAGDVRGLKVLDAGCGTGYLVRQLHRKGADVTGVDISEKMIEIAKKIILIVPFWSIRALFWKK